MSEEAGYFFKKPLMVRELLEEGLGRNLDLRFDGTLRAMPNPMVRNIIRMPLVCLSGPCGGLKLEVL